MTFTVTYPIERALSVREPFASWMFDPEHPKNVENRSWRTQHRGRIWIHVPQQAATAAHRDLGLPADHLGSAVDRYDDPQRSVILGSVEIIDVVHNSASPWARSGFWHWILANPIPFYKPVMWQAGARNLWRHPKLNTLRH